MTEAAFCDLLPGRPSEDPRTVAAFHVEELGHICGACARARAADAAFLRSIRFVHPSRRARRGRCVDCLRDFSAERGFLLLRRGHSGRSLCMDASPKRPYWRGPDRLVVLDEGAYLEYCPAAGTVNLHRYDGAAWPKPEQVLEELRAVFDDLSREFHVTFGWAEAPAVP